MGWENRELAKFVALGDDREKNQVKAVGGILLRLVHGSYQGKPIVSYEYIAKDGEIYQLSGSAGLALKIRSDDIGKFFKATFKGRVRGKGPQPYKDIEVQFYSGEPTEDMRKFPGFDEYYGKHLGPATTENREPPPLDEMPPALQEDDDDGLPFN